MGPKALQIRRRAILASESARPKLKSKPHDASNSEHRGGPSGFCLLSFPEVQMFLPGRMGRKVSSVYRVLKGENDVFEARDKAAEEREAAFEVRNSAVQERDAALQEKDRAVQERDAALEQRDRATAELKIFQHARLLDEAYIPRLRGQNKATIESGRDVAAGYARGHGIESRETVSWIQKR